MKASISRNKRLYVKNSIAYHYCLCGCGELVHVFDKWHKRTFYRRGHQPKRRFFKEENHFWKGGKTLDTKDGYIYIYCPSHPRAKNGRYILEHILVYEDTYNCCLLKWSIVHHKDGNKKNNVWYNLQGMMRREHPKHHRKTAILLFLASLNDI